MPSLSSLFPVISPVEIDGKVYYFKESQLRHMAFLQAFVEHQIPHPYYKVRSGPRPGESHADWIDRVQSAFRESESWKPEYGNPETMKFVDYSKLLGIIISIGLRENNPVPSREECDQLIPLIADDAWDEIYSIFFAKNVQRSLIKLIDPEFGQAEFHDEEGVGWSEAIEIFLDKRQGYTYQTIGDVYIGQWNNFWCRGKEEDYEASMNVDLSSFATHELAAKHLIELSRKQRMKVYGSDKIDANKNSLDESAERAIQDAMDRDPRFHRENPQQSTGDGWVYPDKESQ